MHIPVADAGPRHHEEFDTARRFTVSALAPGSASGVPEVLAWLERCRTDLPWRVRRIPFGHLRGWSFDPETGDLGHHTGRFFTVQGLHVRTGHGWVPTWHQPIINQPEVGILGIVVKEFDGILHCLMQAKVEPGNVNGFQLSPTVQATRSNYTKAHGGADVPYLDLFTGGARSRMLVDVLQSEQGSWFYHKRNRNMIVEVRDEVPVLPHFRWLPLGTVLGMLRHPNAVNMDARTVLACIPFAAPAAHIGDSLGDTALAWSLDQRSGAVHRMSEIISWLNTVKTRHEVQVASLPLNRVKGWQRTEDEIVHEEGRHFRVRAYAVSAPGREVASWTQPLLEPCSEGLVAFLTRSIGGIPHLLVQARFEAGYLDVAELAPTVQCMPLDYAGVPAAQRPDFLSYLSTVDGGPSTVYAGRVWYDTVQSEEGGRFYHARNRYLAVEVDDGFPVTVPDRFRWMSLGQLTALVRHSYYVNIQARSLIAALHTVWAAQR